jgi:hypothetical protein
MMSKIPVPTLGTYPSTREEAGVLKSSVSLAIQLLMRYFMVVSKLILRKGELDSSMPIRLNALYSPLKVMKSPIKLRCL